jgi:hypothetical protein
MTGQLKKPTEKTSQRVVRYAPLPPRQAAFKLPSKFPRRQRGIPDMSVEEPLFEFVPS